MQVVTGRLYNDMGDGFHEFLVVTDTDTDSRDVKIIYVGQFYDAHTLSTIGGSSD